MMINRTTRLRIRRHFRRSKRQVGDIGGQAEEQLERHFLRRLSRLNDVRRFVLSWLGLLVLLGGIVVVQTRALSSYYQELRPVAGGIYTEGMVGSFTNANPIYATSGVDKTVSQLLFASLLKFDEQGDLIGDLAEVWGVDESGRIYTVKLRSNLFWHDGRPLTSGDVVFTYQRIQNPDAKSPLFSSWQGVKVEAPNAQTVTFSLPNVLTSFPFSLTNGIVPEHLLKSIEPGQLRSARFNTAEPVGAGPFSWETVEVHGTTPEDREERVGLVPNKQYHGGAPKIQRFIVRSFRSEERLLKSFENQEVTAMVGVDILPEELDEGELKVKSYSIPLSGAVMAFFNTSHDFLKDPKIRQALVKAADTKQIVSGLGYPAILANSPFLKSHLSYDPALTQFSANIEEANKLLDDAGWTRGQNGIRTKDNRQLSFRLSAQNNSEFTYVGQALQKQWRAIGVAVDVDQPSNNEFKQIVAFHNYDALLYGISLGPDPDVFAYWHSSQADARSPNRLNFSEYNSQQADQSLEGGRTRNDPQLRAVKYRPFLEAWRNDAPALALYQPRFLYIVQGGLYNFDPEVVHSAAGRLNNVHNWMIRQAKTNK